MNFSELPEMDQPDPDCGMMLIDMSEMSPIDGARKITETICNGIGKAKHEAILQAVSEAGFGDTPLSELKKDHLLEVIRGNDGKLGPEFFFIDRKPLVGFSEVDINFTDAGLSVRFGRIPAEAWPEVDWAKLDN